MIEFVLKDRRLRLYPDGTITCRAVNRGKETTTGTWRIVKFSKKMRGYLYCSITVEGVPTKFSQHRLVKFANNPSWDIFDNSKDNCIDHKNHDTKDNTDENLRVVTTQQNHFNRSGVKGYSWDKKNKKWTAQIKLNRKVIHLGRFVKQEDARAAYLEAKERLHIIPP
jgi:hypothetical protein